MGAHTHNIDKNQAAHYAEYTEQETCFPDNK